MTRKTLRAAATEACTFLASPGLPAATNMAAYWTAARSLSRPSDLSRKLCAPCGKAAAGRGEGAGQPGLTAGVAACGGRATGQAGESERTLTCAVKSAIAATGFLSVGRMGWWQRWPRRRLFADPPAWLDLIVSRYS
jgi:hypothetical protein